MGLPTQILINWHNDISKYVAACNSVVVSVKVWNKGKMDSNEVVQLYVTTPKAPGVNISPLYNLIGYNRTHTINAYLMTTVDPTGK